MNEVLVRSSATALRYLISLASREGWSTALRKVQGVSETAVSAQLSDIDRYVGGHTEASVPEELQVVARFLKGASSAQNPELGFASLVSLQRQAGELSARVRVGLPGELLYSGALLMVALMITMLWLIYIAPEFAQLFHGFGANLPTFTRLVVANPLIVILPIAIMAGLLVALVLAARFLANAIGGLHGRLPPWSRWLVGASIGDAQKDWLALSLASAWADAGVSPSQALAQARDGSSGMSNRFDTPLGEAESLGILGDELKFQANEALARLNTAIATHRAIVARTMQILIAVVIGGIVVAIYLPIFQLGGVI